MNKLDLQISYSPDTLKPFHMQFDFAGYQLMHKGRGHETGPCGHTNHPWSSLFNSQVTFVRIE